jgi:CheY-like chemotaxis protein
MPTSVLYADHDADSREMVTVLLGFQNVRVTTAATTAEALRLASTREFDLYLLATRFTDGTGLSLCSALRGLHPAVPIVFHSGDAFEMDLRQGSEAGADAYVVKPDVDRLASVIRNFTSGVLGLARRASVVPAGTEAAVYGT